MQERTAYAFSEGVDIVDHAPRVPASPGVYLLRDADSKPLLLASAQNIRRAVAGRLAEPDTDENTKRADLRSVAKRIEWTRTFGRFETDLVLWQAAGSFYPRDYRERIGFGPAYFLRSDAGERAPRYSITTSYTAHDTARYFGPFITRRDADEYLKMLEDLFDLCRTGHHAELDKSPVGQACAYFEMGRCPAPCDGTQPLDDYRRTFAAAMSFAGGDHAPRLAQLDAAMKAASAAQAFERAASLRTTLQRAQAAVSAPQNRYVGALEQFRWLILDRGGPRTRSRKKLMVRAFSVVGTTIRNHSPVALTAIPEHLSAWLASDDVRADAERPCDEPSRLTADEVVWLVTGVLFREKRTVPLIWRADDVANATNIVREVEAALAPQDQGTAQPLPQQDGQTP